MRQSCSGCVDHGVAVIDDFYIIGPPQQAYPCFDRFRDGLPNLLLNLNLRKCITLLPDNPTEDLIYQCTSRNLIILLSLSQL